MAVRYGYVLLSLFIAFAAVLEWQRRAAFRPHLLDWKNSKVLVTGASSGLGREIARQLCLNGARVLIVARRELELKKTAAFCPDGKAHILAVDVSAKNASDDVSKAIDSHFNGSVDVMLLNHGVLAIKPFQKFTDADLDAAEDVMRINYHSYVRLISKLFRKVRRGGSIASMGSVSGVLGPLYYSAYSASKFALRGFMESVRNDLKDTGIYFTMLLPGYVWTELHDAMMIGNARMINVDSWMPVDEAASKLLFGIARGDRQVFIEHQTFFAQFFEGVFRYAGNLIDFPVSDAVRKHVQLQEGE